MKETVCAVRVGVALGLCLLWSMPARAGVADSPLPVLGATTLHLYSVPGVIDGGGLATYFACPSTDTAAMRVGVELFGPAGGAPGNEQRRPPSMSAPVRR